MLQYERNLKVCLLPLFGIVTLQIQGTEHHAAYSDLGNFLEGLYSIAVKNT